MPYYSWHNLDTDEYVEIFSHMSERDIPPDTESRWERVFEMPAFKRVTYADGQRKDWTDFKKIAKLEVAKANLAGSDPQRAEIDNEISQRRKINKKGV